MGAKEKRPALPTLCARGHHAVENDPRRERIPGIVARILESLDADDSPDHVGYPMIPSHTSLVEIHDLYMTLLMPGYFGNQAVDSANIGFHIGETADTFYRLLEEQVSKCLIHECAGPARPECDDCFRKGADVALALLDRIPDMRKRLAQDIEAAYDGDPAAKSQEEIIFCYPGLSAITVYRFAHELHLMGVPILPRMLTEYAHSRTGCDIHPGAEIGRRFFIDHATGVVIGETTIIGDRVRIYQGVTLGGANFEVDDEGRLIRDHKRHPTIESDCVIYAGATILGGETVVGKGSVVGGNVWLTRSLKPYTKVISNAKEQSIIPMDEK